MSCRWVHWRAKTRWSRSFRSKGSIRRKSCRWNRRIHFRRNRNFPRTRRRRSGLRTGAVGGRRALPRKRAAQRQLEGAAGFGVEVVGVGVGAVGGELDFHAAIGDFGDEEV